MFMRTKIGLGVLILGVAAIALMVTIQPSVIQKKNKAQEEVGSGSPMGNGDAGNPDARMEYELLRHADPVTGEIPAGIRGKELAFAKRLPQNEEKTLTWEQTGQLNNGGRTRAVAYDITDPNIIMAGGVTGGMWRSTNGGQSFVKTTDPTQIHSVTSVDQDTRTGNENVWYYGTGEYYGIVSGTSFTSRFSGDGIFKSVDAGQSWTKLSSTASGTPETLYANGDFDFVWRIVTDHTNAAEDVVMAAVYNGIFRSVDGGQNWTQVLGFNVNNAPAYSDFTDIIKTPSGIFYAALSSGSPAKGFYRSDDGGVTWASIGGGANLPNTYRRTVMAANPSNENEVYFLTETPTSGQHGHSFWKYTYISGDGSGAGGTWDDRTLNLPNGSCTGYFTFDFGFYTSQSSYDMCVTVHPTDGNVVYIGGTSLYRSTDGFSTNTNTDWIGGYWCRTDPSDYVYTNHHPDQHYLIFNPVNPDEAISASDGGLSITTDIRADSVGWQYMNKGYLTTQFYTVSMEHGNVSNDIMLGGLQDNGSWWSQYTGTDSTWKYVHIDDGAYCAVADNQDFYVFSSQLGRMYKEDIDANGNVVGKVRVDPTGGPTNYNFINAFILDPNNTDRLYLAARTRVWRNDDLSAIPYTGDIYNTVSTNWTNMYQTQIGINDGVITVLEMSRALPNTIYYGTSKSKLYRLDSAEVNPLKTNISSSEFPLNSYISSIAPNPFDGGELMVTFSNYSVRSIFHSLDSGQTFVSVSGNLEQNIDGSGNGPAVYWSSVYPNGTYFVGTSIGLFSTTQLDGDNTIWVQEGPTTIANTVINMIKTRPYDGRIVVATHGSGIFTADMPPVHVGVTETSANELELTSYPNPFIEQVTIGYSLTEAAKVELAVFDLQGKMVEQLVNKSQGEGAHQVTWNPGRSVAEGTYVCRLRLGDQYAVRKLVINR
jgi:hypothetical protein